MFAPRAAFSGFSVDDLDAAHHFYADTLGLQVVKDGIGLVLQLPGGGTVWCYPKGHHHAPATFTMLNFRVDDIESAVDELTSRGVTFERYAGVESDARGIAHPAQSPHIAWFKDPAGNVLALLQD